MLKMISGQLNVIASFTVLIVLALLLIMPTRAGSASSSTITDHSSIDVPGEPDITILLDESEYSADVEPGSDGVVHITGTITCDMPPGTSPTKYCVVTLQVEAGGWPVSVPPSFSFNINNEQEDFTLAVQVPIETSANVQGQLSVTGKWSYSPGVMAGTVGPVTAMIYIVPYGQPMLRQSTENVTAPIGSWTDIELVIMNQGNCADRITVSIDSKPDNVEAYLINTELVIPEKQDEEVVLRVKQKIGGPSTNKIVISLSSQHQGTRANTTQPVFFESRISIKGFVTNPVTIGISVVLMISILVAAIFVAKKKGIGIKTLMKRTSS